MPAACSNDRSPSRRLPHPICIHDEIGAGPRQLTTKTSKTSKTKPGVLARVFEVFEVFAVQEQVTIYVALDKFRVDSRLDAAAHRLKEVTPPDLVYLETGTTGTAVMVVGVILRATAGTGRVDRTSRTPVPLKAGNS